MECDSKEKKSIRISWAKPKVGKCTYCKTTLNANVVLYHEQECAHRPIQCPDCSIFMILKDIDKHHCKSIKESGRDQNKNNSGFMRYKNSAVGNKSDDLHLTNQPKKSESEYSFHKLKPEKFASEISLLSKHFKDLFTNENCWDTVVQVEDEEYKVHRAILVARSSVFASMFQHDTSEKQTGIIKISDCDPGSFKIFLEYLYSGDLENVSYESAIHLYTISEKYNVQELKICCTEFLKQNITAQNTSEIAILANMYEEVDLFSAVQDFFNNNFKEIVRTNQWEDLLKSNFRLANKLLIEKSKND